MDGQNFENENNVTVDTTATEVSRLHIGRIKGWRFHEWHLYAAVGIMIGNFILKNILLLKFHITL